MTYASYQSQIHKLLPAEPCSNGEKVGFARCQIHCEAIAAKWDLERQEMLARIDDLEIRIMRGKKE